MKQLRNSIPWAAVLGGLLVSGACGDGGGDDPEDSTPDTTAPTTTITPGPARARTLPDTVFLVPNEMATVYYTVDGTEPTTDSPSAEIAASVSGIQDGVPVQFFSVDAAGNAEAVQSATFSADTQGPNPVMSLAAVVAANDVALTWTNPVEDDFAGVIVVVAAGGVTVAGEPEPGVLYGANDTLPNGDTVIFAGDAAAYTDAAVAGMREYAVWAHDDLGNYSMIATTQAAAPIPAQNASISVDLATEVVTITQPTGLVLTAQATYDDANDRLEIQLSTRNESGRILYALKALASNLNTGDFDNTPDTFRDQTSYPLGGYGLRPGSERSTLIELNGIDGATSPVTFDLEYLNNAIVIQGRIYDALGARVTGGSNSARFPFGRDAGGVFVDSMRGLAFYTARDKRVSGIYVVDLGTGNLVASFGASDLPLSSSSRLTQFGNELLTLTTNGAHRHAGDGDDGGPGSASFSQVELVRGSMISMEETGRYAIPGTSDAVVGSALGVSQDGTTAALVVARYGTNTNELWFFDLVNEVFIDTDAVTDGIQPVTLSADAGLASDVVWNGNATVYVGYTNKSGQNGTSTVNGGDGTSTPPIDVIDATTFALSSFMTPVSSNRVIDLRIRNNNLYINTTGGLAIRDLSNNTDTTVTTPFGDLGPMNFTPDGLHYWVTGYSNDECGLARFDVATNTLQDLDEFPTNGTDTTANSVCGVPRGSLAATSF